MTMKTQKFGKLLAVVTLATASPAVANPTKTPPRAVPAKAAEAPKPPEMPAQFYTTEGRALVEKVLAASGVVPRKLPNGTPACGNVQSKMSSEQAAKAAKQKQACEREQFAYAWLGKPLAENH